VPASIDQRLVDLGTDATVLEAAAISAARGHWNRYPGRVSIRESYTYGYSLSRERWKEWNRKETLLRQPGESAHINTRADKFGLRP